MKLLQRLRAMNRVREEMSFRVEKGVHPEQAAEEALKVVQAEFADQGVTAIDWATLLPLLLQLVMMLAELFKKP